MDRPPGQAAAADVSPYAPPADALEALETRLRAALAPHLQLVRSIGAGGMARVFLAREPALKRLVAVKVLSADLAASAADRARFEREAQAVAGLSHPNIVAIHSVGELDDRTPYFVMQYVEGRSMAARVEEDGPLSVAEARRALGEVAAALAAAHKQGIIHRDIKPANILYEDATGRSLVSDFGIAALSAPDQTAPAPMRLTGTGMMIGTPQYMSPEQLLAEPVSEKTDLYSLGLLAHELLVGEGPFRASNPHELIAAHLRDTPKRLAERRADVDPEVDEIVARCLIKNASQRPTADEVARRLTPGGATLLEWPPPGVEELHGRMRALSTLYWWGSVPVVGAILSAFVAGVGMRSAVASATTMLLMLLAMMGAILLGVALWHTVKTGLRTGRLARAGYAWGTLLETLADTRGDSGNVIAGTREYAALKPEQRDRVRRYRLIREVALLAGGMIAVPLLAFALAVGARGLLGPAGVISIATLPLYAAAIAFVLAQQERRQFGRLRARKVAAAVDLTKLATPWYESFEVVRVGQRLGRGLAGAVNAGSAAAIGAALLLGVMLLALVPVTIVASVGPSFWVRAIPKFANTRSKALVASPTRAFGVPKDSTITPIMAGRAFVMLLEGTGSTREVRRSPSPFAPNPAPSPALPLPVWRDSMPSGLFPNARPNEADGLPAVLKILKLPPQSFTPAERAYLERIAHAPHWAAVETVARAPRMDFMGAHFRLPFADSVGFWSLPLPRFVATREVAYAGASRAAYFLSRGQRDSAEATLRTVISYGWAIADNGNTLIEQLVGIVIAAIGRQGLIDYYGAVGDPRGARLRAQTDSLVAIVEARSNASDPVGALGINLSDPKEARALISRLVTDEREARGLRMELLTLLAASPCTNVRELIFGHAQDVEATVANMYGTWARYPSDSSLLDMIRRSPLLFEQLPEQNLRNRAIIGASKAAAAVLRNPRLAECTAMLMAMDG